MFPAGWWASPAAATAGLAWCSEAEAMPSQPQHVDEPADQVENR
jgi:hypothetical protein